MDVNDLMNRFRYHPPKDESVAQTHQQIRDTLLKLALDLNEVLPDGREKALSITHLEETMMWANAAIARNQSDVYTKKGV